MRAWPSYLPDLTLWHPWHSQRGTLPLAWRGLDLPGVCRDLGVPVWSPAKPWRIELPGIELRDLRGDTERIMEWGTPRGTLRSRWTLGPDGDWWQAEYPVKARDDLAPALLIAEARRYVLQPRANAPQGQEVIHAIELPQRPWSELFHAFLGWSEGIMLFLEEPEALSRIVTVLEEKLAELEAGLARSPCDALLCPDNLDGQFISPADFEAHLGKSYQRTAAVMHEKGKKIVAHVGGPVRRLLPGLAAAGIDCIEGICAAPQGDSPLPEARAAVGADLTLWGGLAQDYLLANRSEADFVAAAREALQQTAADPCAILGIADRVPVDALAERLVSLTSLAREVDPSP
jgi:hypothetical protein